MLSTKDKAIQCYKRLLERAEFYGDTKEIARYKYYIKHYDTMEAEDNQEDEFNKNY